MRGAAWCTKLPVPPDNALAAPAGYSLGNTFKLYYNTQRAAPAGIGLDCTMRHQRQTTGVAYGEQPEATLPAVNNLRQPTSGARRHRPKQLKQVLA